VLSVNDAGGWRRVVTVHGDDQLAAFDLALTALPRGLAGKPVQFRADDSPPDDSSPAGCHPPGDGDGRGA
jgi:hypothetical protein